MNDEVGQTCARHHTLDIRAAHFFLRVPNVYDSVLRHMLNIGEFGMSQRYQYMRFARIIDRR